MKFTKKEIFNIPNIMGYVRILLIPVFVTLYVKGFYTWALVALAVNIMTDFFDGIVARKFNQITELGKFIDPLADKLSQAAVVVLLAFTYPLLWPVFIIEFIKENTMLFGGGYIFKKKGRKLNGAKWYGKLSTWVVDSTMVLLLLLPAFPVYAANILIAVCAFFMLFALHLYSKEYRSLIREKTE